MPYESESFDGFVIKKYLDFHQGCEDVSTNECLESFELYLKAKIGLPHPVVELSIQRLKESPLFKVGDSSPQS